MHTRTRTVLPTVTNVNRVVKTRWVMSRRTLAPQLTSAISLEEKCVRFGSRRHERCWCQDGVISLLWCSFWERWWPCNRTPSPKPAPSCRPPETGNVNMVYVLLVRMQLAQDRPRPWMPATFIFPHTRSLIYPPSYPTVTADDGSRWSSLCLQSN